ncbi:putative Ig domain protein [Rubripirellula obstinata]|uniref:Putative Ig domain protein n=1 Tax=Rubripirellula obstinata TaxID=406547 RepID=A0A5B1CQA0_9BACT|nr:Ig-like domain-containing protein [Rubripirellula obstinata]KAA1261810.1 putative Ig domain protein [Rubripirellula obstinata]
MIRNSKRRSATRKKSPKRRFLIETLEARQLLAVDGVQIDLSGNGSIDLFGSDSGGSVHQGYINNVVQGQQGITIGTSNTPGVNNLSPNATNDSFDIGEDDAVVDVTALLLADDSDPDNSGTLRIVGIDTQGTRGLVGFDAASGSVTYAPSGRLDDVADGTVETDTFRYLLDDGNNGRSFGTVTVNVAGSNDAPFVDPVEDLVTDEGSTAMTAGIFGDIDNGTVANIASNIGQITDNGDGTWSWTLNTTDGPDEVFDVTVTATDEGLLTAQTTFRVEVVDVPATIEVNGADSVDEGTLYELNLGDVTDPGNETITQRIIDWGDGTEETVSDAATQTHIYGGDVTDATIRVMLVDEDGSHVAASKTIRIDNVAPKILTMLDFLSPTTTRIDAIEGLPTSLVVIATDPGGDAVSMAASVGSLTLSDEGYWRWSLNTTDGPSQSQTVTLTATDADGASSIQTIDLVVVNAAPTITSDFASVTIDEGQPALMTGAFADVVADTVTLTATAGTVTQSDSGQWVWHFDQTGGSDASEAVTITASDEDGGTSEVTFDLVVTNLAPIAGNPTFAGAKNQLQTYSVVDLLSGATDPGDDGLAVQSIVTATNGSIEFDDANDTFTYQPADDFVGNDTIEFLIVDVDGASTTAFATVVVTNDAPAIDAIAAISTAEMSSLTFQVNGNDANGDALTFALGDDAPLGAAITDEGLFSWTPSESQGPSSHSFDISVSDGFLTTTTVVAIDVTEVNSAPAMASVNPQTINEGSTLTFSVSASDADLPANTLAFSLGDNAPIAASISPDGTFTWTPQEADGPGTFEFDVIVSDGELSDTQTVTIVVVDVPNAPVIEAVESQVIAEGQTLSLQVNATDSDLPAQTLSFSLGADAPSGATVGDDGIFSWTPGEADGGNAFTFDVIVSDGGLSNTTALTIQVDEVNQAPVLDFVGDHSINELESLTFSATGSDADLPQANLVFSLSDNAPADATITQDGNFSWTPTESDGAGIFTFDVIVSDGAESDSETVTITVAEVNVAPVLDSIAAKTIGEGATLAFTASATDADLPDNPLEYSLGSDAPSGASMSANGDFTWTPTEADGPGVFTFNVVVSDGVLSDATTVTVTVEEVNVAPTWSLIETQTINELADFVLIVAATDVDEPENVLTYSATGNVPAGVTIASNGTIQWTPTEEQGPASYTFDLVASDGQLSSSTPITINVAEVNQAPQLDAIGVQSVDEGSTLSFVAAATDDDLPSNSLQFSLAGTVPTGALITADGTFTWTPQEADGPGTFEFDVVVSDGELSDTQTVTIEVVDVPNAPVIASIEDQTVAEGQTLTFTATATDSDLPADTLTFRLDGSAPEDASITADGHFSWTPNELFGGDSVTFDILVSDGELEAIESLTIYVDEVNQFPLLQAIDDHDVNELETLSFTVNATDADLPVPLLSYSLGENAPAGASINDLGEFAWTPNEEDGPGTFTFEVNVSDGELSVTETTTVTVGEVNTAPKIAQLETYIVNEGEAFSFTATASDFDAPNNSLSFSLGDAAPATATMTPAGVFTWSPDEADGPGSFSFDVIVSDGFATDATSVTIEVGEVNVAPILALIDPQSIDELATLTFQAAATDLDQPATPLTFQLAGDAPQGASISTEGFFSWTPSESQGPNTYSFDVVVSDSVLTDTQTIEVTVGEVNLAPTLMSIADQTVDEGQTLTLSLVGSDLDLPNNNLTFSLGDDAPAGASITPDGDFSWTPTEAQGPDSFEITVQISDGTVTTSESFQVDVQDVPNAPVIQPIPNQQVDEGVELQLKIDASDSDLPKQTLFFSLGDNAPSDLTLSSSGMLQWTPTETDGGEKYTFDIVVSDGVLESTTPVVIEVNEVNQPPIMQVVEAFSIQENSEFNLLFRSTDLDQPAQSLTYSLVGSVPFRAAISADGEFSWAPSEAEGPSERQIHVQVTDGLETVRQTVTIQVEEVNESPQWTDLPDQELEANFPFELFLQATDADHPRNTLTYRFSGPAPVGATLTTAGLFAWTPSPQQIGSHQFQFDVSDDGGATFATSPLVNFDVVSERFEDIGESATNLFILETDAGNATKARGAQFTHRIQHPDLHVYSRLYVKSPSDSEFQLAESSIEWVDHDKDDSTNKIMQINYDHTIVAPDLSDSTLGNMIDGVWTVLVDLDYDFHPANPQPDLLNDRLFTFTVDSAAIALPPSVRFTSPSQNAFLPGVADVRFDWESDPDFASDDRVALVIGKNSDDVYDKIVNSTLRSHSVSDLPENSWLDALLISLKPLPGFATAPKPVDGFVAPRFAPINGSESDALFDDHIGFGLRFDELTFRTRSNAAPRLSATSLTRVVAAGETLEMNIQATDEEGDAISYRIENAPDGLTFSSDGQLQWTPTSDQLGTYSTTVYADDFKGESHIDTMTLTLIVPNQKPVLQPMADPTFLVGRNSSFQILATDEEQDPIRYSIGVRPSGVEVDSSGLVTWTPSATDVGVHTIRVFAYGNRGYQYSEGVDVNVTVEYPPSEPPVLEAVSSQTLNGFLPFEYQLNATDPDGDAIYYSLSGAPSGVSIDAGGLLSWNAGNQHAGVHNFDIIVSDRVRPENFDTQPVQLTVIESLNKAELYFQRTTIGDEPSKYSATLKLTFDDQRLQASTKVWVTAPNRQPIQATLESFVATMTIQSSADEDEASFMEGLEESWLVEIDFDGVSGNSDEAAFSFSSLRDDNSLGNNGFYRQFPSQGMVGRVTHGQTFSTDEELPELYLTDSTGTAFPRISEVSVFGVSPSSRTLVQTITHQNQTLGPLSDMYQQFEIELTSIQTPSGIVSGPSSIANKHLAQIRSISVGGMIDVAIIAFEIRDAASQIQAIHESPPQSESSVLDDEYMKMPAQADFNDSLSMPQSSSGKLADLVWCGDEELCPTVDDENNLWDVKEELSTNIDGDLVLLLANDQSVERAGQ